MCVCVCVCVCVCPVFSLCVLCCACIQCTVYCVAVAMAIAKDDSALSCGFEPKRGSSRIVKHKVKVRYPSFFLVHGDMIHAGSRVLWCGYEACIAPSVTVCVSTV